MAGYCCSFSISGLSSKRRELITKAFINPGTIAINEIKKIARIQPISFERSWYHGIESQIENAIHVIANVRQMTYLFLIDT
jgi:hypothetical protein